MIISTLSSLDWYQIFSNFVKHLFLPELNVHKHNNFFSLIKKCQESNCFRVLPRYANTAYALTREYGLNIIAQRHLAQYRVEGDETLKCGVWTDT